MKKELVIIEKNLSLPVPIQNVNLDWINTNLQLDVLRLDLLHPIINGNKWCKLIRTIEDIDCSNINGIITCGGNYSNHLHVIGYISYLLNIECHAIIREGTGSSFMLDDLRKWGVNIIYCSREYYRGRYSSKWWDSYINSLRKGKYCIIPEGGSSEKAVYGTYRFFQDILNHNYYDEVLLSLGTGATYAGVVAAAPATTNITGVSVLKKYERQLVNIKKWLSSFEVKSKYVVATSSSLAYGKVSRELLDFLEEWYNNTGIPIEPMYTAKLFFFIYNKLKLNAWPKNSKILAIHTGGLQGLRGQKKLFCELEHEELWNKLSAKYF